MSFFLPFSASLKSHTYYLLRILNQPDYIKDCIHSKTSLHKIIFYQISFVLTFSFSTLLFVIVELSLNPIAFATIIVFYIAKTLFISIYFISDVLQQFLYSDYISFLNLFSLFCTCFRLILEFLPIVVLARLNIYLL